MARRRLVITIPSDTYHRLAELAEAEERAVDQQASLLLKRLLTDATTWACDSTPNPDEKHARLLAKAEDGRRA